MRNKRSDIIIVNTLLRQSFSILALLLLCINSGVACAQTHTPKPGSAERKAIMDAVRLPVEKELHQKVIFVVSKLTVQGNWAFTIATPKKPDGKAVDYRHTRYKGMVKDGESVGDAFGGEVIALLKKKSGHWKVVTYDIGASDVVYWDWDKKYHAPSSLFDLKK